MTSNRGQNGHLIVSSLQLVISSRRHVISLRRLVISSCRLVISSRRLVISSCRLVISSCRLVVPSCRSLNSCELIISSPGLVVSSRRVVLSTCRLVESTQVNSSSRRGTSRHFKYQEDSGTKKHKLHKPKYPCAILPPGTLTLRFTNCGNFDFAKSFLPSDSHANTVISYRFA